MNYYKEALKMHEMYKGKIEIRGKFKPRTKDELAIVYTPGVAEPCKKILEHPEAAYKYTNKGNTVAIVTDGSAVLGLGNIGATAAIPVMEGKALLFKQFAGIDAIPLCIKTQDPHEIVRLVKNLEPILGGVNLEDIAAPQCFQIEKELQEALAIPVFHDDQHGTAIVVTAAVLNSLRVVKKELGQVKIVINGAGAAGTAIARLLMAMKPGNLIVCDKNGILNPQDKSLSDEMRQLAQITNCSAEQGILNDALIQADIFIGVSAPNVVTTGMISSMEKNAIVFSMANPEPEILPHLAKEGGARIVGTGRSDYPNQINNVLAFPGVFKGALQARAQRITEPMKIAAAHALAAKIPQEELSEENIIPSVFSPNVAKAVAKAVSEAWGKR